jgi:hypothetical protein
MGVGGADNPDSFSEDGNGNEDDDYVNRVLQFASVDSEDNQ